MAAHRPKRRGALAEVAAGPRQQEEELDWAGVVEAWAAAHLLEEDDGRTEERKKESADLSWIWRVK